jgi:hypothetical protein
MRLDEEALHVTAQEIKPLPTPKATKYLLLNRAGFAGLLSLFASALSRAGAASVA